MLRLGCHFEISSSIVNYGEKFEQLLQLYLAIGNGEVFIVHNDIIIYSFTLQKMLGSNEVLVE